jgi:2-methylcitrate dehydratase
MDTPYVTLPRDDNQARALGQYAIDFVWGRLGEPDGAVYQQTDRFLLDSVACGVSAIALGTNAPSVLRGEALDYELATDAGATCFGSDLPVAAEKAVAANCAAVREWDSNGTNFGYNPATGNCRGEFGHNDFYPVVIAGAQQIGCEGHEAVRAMIALDEIRGRLAEVFALRDHKIDHVVHGAIASAAVYGAMLGATADEIESAIGMYVAHYIPFRAIRAGHQLSDSKGASAAISAEAAVMSVHRALRGFVGPADIFRNPQAIFCLFEPPKAADTSPFDLVLSHSGDDFAVMGMHFKLGLYEHQSAGAIEGVIRLLSEHPGLLSSPDAITAIRITAYEPAFSIIGDPAKRNPTTRQSADHSMVYIVATLLRKALSEKQIGWKELMLTPADYDDASLVDPVTRQLMSRIEFQHGGADYDARYPDGIPTSVTIEHRELDTVDSGLVMYPQGHARADSSELDDLLDHKFNLLASLAVDDPASLRARFNPLSSKTAHEIRTLHDFEINTADA